ncbi:hypothetical protein BPY_14800 [Bifidobacterium psychraerophilum]
MVQSLVASSVLIVLIGTAARASASASVACIESIHASLPTAGAEASADSPLRDEGADMPFPS